jgi:hypothetical protein
MSNMKKIAHSVPDAWLLNERGSLLSDSLRGYLEMVSLHPKGSSYQSERVIVVIILSIEALGDVLSNITILLVCNFDGNTALGSTSVLCFFQAIAHPETGQPSASSTILSKLTAPKEAFDSVSVIE